jgi:hypothetical protein
MIGGRRAIATTTLVMVGGTDTQATMTTVMVGGTDTERGERAITIGDHDDTRTIGDTTVTRTIGEEGHLHATVMVAAEENHPKDCSRTMSGAAGGGTRMEGEMMTEDRRPLETKTCDVHILSFILCVRCTDSPA